MKISELEKILSTTLHHEPITISGDILSSCCLSLTKASKITRDIINILKQAAGDPYPEGETEEVTFGCKTWFLTLEEE